MSPHKPNMVRLAVIACMTCLAAGCDRSAPDADPQAAGPRVAEQSPAKQKDAPAPPLVAAARRQVGKTTIYDPAYVRLAYPGGDVPIERGVCSDVVIRALRDSAGMDLQKLVHEDMTRAFSEYPALWGLRKPDSNIDHRRVPNLQRYFERQGYSLAVTANKDDYLPGDLVTCTVGRNLAHIMIVSDRAGADGNHLVIHNIGGGAREEDRLFEFPITGHYRIKEPARTR